MFFKKNISNTELRCAMLEKQIKSLEAQINAILPLLVEKKDLADYLLVVEKKLDEYGAKVRASVNSSVGQVANEAARALIMNVRSGNESINFIQEIVTRIKSLQLDIRPASWELRNEKFSTETAKKIDHIPVMP